MYFYFFLRAELQPLQVVVTAESSTGGVAFPPPPPNLLLECFLTLPLQAVVTALRSQALKPDSRPAPGSHRLTRELSEVTSSGNAGRGSHSGEATSMEDPTSVVALLNVAGMQTTSMWHNDAHSLSACSASCMINCCGLLMSGNRQLREVPCSL